MTSTKWEPMYVNSVDSVGGAYVVKGRNEECLAFDAPEGRRITSVQCAVEGMGENLLVVVDGEIKYLGTADADWSFRYPCDPFQALTVGWVRFYGQGKKRLSCIVAKADK